MWYVPNSYGFKTNILCSFVTAFLILSQGDDVRFSDGTSGKIEKLGWFETMIRNSDELVVGIPNTQVR